MTAARLVLERSTMMLLTSSKVRLRRRRPLIYFRSLISFLSRFVSTDKSETSRMYIFQGEPWYGLLSNEKGHGLNTLRRQRRRAGDIKRTKRIETSEFTSLVPSSVDWNEAPRPNLDHVVTRLWFPSSDKWKQAKLLHKRRWWFFLLFFSLYWINSRL